MGRWMPALTSNVAYLHMYLTLLVRTIVQQSHVLPLPIPTGCFHTLPGYETEVQPWSCLHKSAAPHVLEQGNSSNIQAFPEEARSQVSWTCKTSCDGAL
jgi:hypothetical protein